LTKNSESEQATKGGKLKEGEKHVAFVSSSKNKKEKGEGKGEANRIRAQGCPPIWGEV